jgi:Arc/MetJ family transcription regulator
VVRTTLEIDEKLLVDVVEATGQKSKSRTVSSVLKEYIRRRRFAELRALAGNIDMVDNLEELELKEQEHLRW